MPGYQRPKYQYLTLPVRLYRMRPTETITAWPRQWLEVEVRNPETGVFEWIPITGFGEESWRIADLTWENPLVFGYVTLTR